jgi:hypothetical protein
MDDKRVPAKDGISEYPLVQFYSWQDDEQGERHTMIKCFSVCPFCSYRFNYQGQEHKLSAHNKYFSR